MPFEINPALPEGPGFEVAPGSAAPATDFAVAPGAGLSSLFTVAPGLPPLVPPSGEFGAYMQWLHDGVALGRPTIRVVEFVGPFQGSRGVDDQAHVVTVKYVPTFTYFTTVYYPRLVIDAMAVAVPGIVSGWLLGQTSDQLALAVPAIAGGSMPLSILYTTYGPKNEDMSIAVPALAAGALTVVILYTTYGPKNEDMSIAVPALVAGTLVVVISYVNYTNYPLESTSIAVPSIVAGTLA